MIKVHEDNVFFLSDEEKRAVDYIGDKLRETPEEITTAQIVRALLFWAAKLKLQYELTGPYPVSKSLANFKPYQNDAVVEIEAAKASADMLGMLTEADLSAYLAPDIEGLEPEGPVLTIQEFDEMIHKQIMGD